MQQAKDMADVLKMSRVARLRCVECGVEMDAACSCGKPYIPAGELAAKLIQEHPEMSSRAIAAKTGIARQTVDRARSGGPNEPPDSGARVTGLDGKSYPSRGPAKIPAKEDLKRKKTIFLVTAHEAALMAEYDGQIDDDIIDAVARTERAWNELKMKLIQRRLKC